MTHEPLDQLQARLATEYPGWHFWRAVRGDGTLGDLMATRKAHITEGLLAKGLARTLPMGIGHNVSLEDQLAEQASIEAGLTETVLH